MRARRHIIDVQNDPFAKQSSLVCLVQTGFDADEVIQWPGRRCMPHASRGFGKGVCCFTNSDLEHENLFRTRLASEHFQLVKITMKEKIQVFIVYISPHTTNMEQISEAINELIMPNLDIIILGDFNFHANQKKPNHLNQYLKSTLGLKQMISVPTFTFGPNILDHVYISPSMEHNIKIIHRFNYYTDHMSFNISLNIEKEVDNKNEHESSSTDDDSELFQCKFCDETFPTTTDKEAHEKKFHPTIHPDEKTILE